MFGCSCLIRCMVSFLILIYLRKKNNYLTVIIRNNNYLRKLHICILNGRLHRLERLQSANCVLVFRMQDGRELTLRLPTTAITSSQWGCMRRIRVGKVPLVCSALCVILSSLCHVPVERHWRMDFGVRSSFIRTTCRKYIHLRVMIMSMTRGYPVNWRIVWFEMCCVQFILRTLHRHLFSKALSLFSCYWFNFQHSLKNYSLEELFYFISDHL